MVGISFQSGAERPYSSGLRVAHALSGIIDGRIDMFTDQIDANLATAFERDVGELHSQSLLELNRDDLVFLCRARASHLHAVASPRSFLYRRDVVLGGLVGCLGVDP